MPKPSSGEGVPPTPKQNKRYNYKKKTKEIATGNFPLRLVQLCTRVCTRITSHVLYISRPPWLGTEGVQGSGHGDDDVAQAAAVAAAGFGGEFALENEVALELEEWGGCVSYIVQ